MFIRHLKLSEALPIRFLMSALFKRIRNSRSRYLLISLFLHLLLFLSMAISRISTPVLPAQETVEVTYEAAPPTPAEKRLSRKTKSLPQQVVEQNDKRLNDEKNDSRFLSRFDQVVKRQTRARESGAFTNTAENSQSQSGSKDGIKTKAKTKIVDQKRGELPKLSDLSPRYSLTPNSIQEEAKNPGRPSQTDDYLKDVDVGMQTLLSTREFLYYSYYQRIKEALRQHWEPTVREKVKIMFRRGRTLASAKDRITQVLITLDSAGDLIRVEVLGQSGVQDLDEAAIEAFRKSAPFPNPPKGIVESDGRIRIRWDFILEA